MWYGRVERTLAREETREVVSEIVWRVCAVRASRRDWIAARAGGRVLRWVV